MSIVPVMKRVLLYGGVLALAIGVVGSVVGYLVADGSGVISALLGTAMAVVFLAITAISILIASKYNMAAFFGIVMGAWLLKFIVFLVLVLMLKDQPWVHPQVMFLSIVAGVIGTLVVDVVVIAKSRMPYVSDIELPGDGKDEKASR
ncbi:MAG: hypothetical protein JWP30_1406 [Homoserinimonas sp.]|jgi:hypothetical protein|nr:hypothetical protein [Homoserinimonas sp.]